MDNYLSNRKRRTTVNSKYNIDYSINEVNTVKLGRRRGNISSNHQSQQSQFQIELDKGKMTKVKRISNKDNEKGKYKEKEKENEILDDDSPKPHKQIIKNENKHKGNSVLLGNNNVIEVNLKKKEKFMLIPSRVCIDFDGITDQTINYYMNEKPANVTQTFLYKSFIFLPDLSNYITDLIEVRISSEYLTIFNKAFKKEMLYGSDIYTSNSDAVMILAHCGFITLDDKVPSKFEGISIYFRVSKNRSSYNSSVRYGIRSYKNTTFQGHSIKPEGFSFLSSLGSDELLSQSALRMPLNTEITKYNILKINSSKASKREVVFSIENTPLVYNLSYELSYEYSLSAIIDKSYGDYKDYLSYILKNKVMYLETKDERWELATMSREYFKERMKDGKENQIDVCALSLKERSESEMKYSSFEEENLFEKQEAYMIRKVKDPYMKDNKYMIDTTKIPLEKDEILYSMINIDWNDIRFGLDSLYVKSLKIENILSFKYYKIK